MKISSFIYLVTMGLIISISPSFVNNSFGQMQSGDLTEPTMSNLYGGEKKGTLEVNSQNDEIQVLAMMDESPNDDEVYEGWFEDKGDASGYSLSLGKFDENNRLNMSQTMVNPFTYTIFYVTAEPKNDPDPNPSDVIASMKLDLPFGQ